MNVLSAVAQFERDLLIERTMAGLKHAQSESKKSGRKALLTDTDRAALRSAIEGGITIAQLVRDHGTSRRQSCGARVVKASKAVENAGTA
jgi:putative DNA-invertase from lambdoid prophage Rac